MKDIITVEEAARFLRRHPDTIRRWIDAKKLKARHLSAGGHGIYAILRTDLLEYAFAASQKSGRIKKQKKKTQESSTQRPLPL